ncbi:glycosyltransferase family 39 protein [Myxococcus xanthus]|uniref:Phospholipid carrier-dependent glycosyltransferase n=1 Tax=Myxococcus xanthus TaxID=34 RepID=A0A7Y4MSD3_MYXXA|nr:glycosyltransferase family 39 protein [Myxococcus xanthus]NOJ80400.1 phospholipid carrier-dependent glycosyltransferase [Myxococcus xanthus]NOJ84933.1 phospholipid carrier-dependent glycosyltransferase [Myxococcus xanthus]
MEKMDALSRLIRKAPWLDGATSSKPSAPNYGWALVGLVSVVLILHLLIIDQPSASYVFDEAHYVPAAKCLVDGAVCNEEHPPLAKALIALSIQMFGDRGFGWRLPSVLFGSFTLALVYLLTRRFTDDRVALLAAFLLGFENLWFVHSSIAMLDIPAFFFAALGVYLFTGQRWWLSGLALGIGMLAKGVVAMVFIALVFYVLVSQERWLSKAALKVTARIGFSVGIPAALSFLVGLGIYDVVYQAFPSPLHHIASMANYHQTIGSPGMSDSVHPLRWFSGFPNSPYFVTSTGAEDGSIPRYILQYLDQPNLVILLFAWLAIPLVWSDIRERHPLVLLASLMIGVPYLLFILVAQVRVTYPFYMLLFVPSQCILSALALSKLPCRVMLTFCTGVLVWFFYWFPRNPLAPWE